MVAVIINFLMVGAYLYVKRLENSQGAANLSTPYVRFLIDRAYRVGYKPPLQ